LLHRTDKEKLFYGNARRILNLRDPVTPEAGKAAPSPSLTTY
jgi:hypothetical protein